MPVAVEPAQAEEVVLLVRGGTPWRSVVAGLLLVLELVLVTVAVPSPGGEGAGEAGSPYS